MDDEPGVKIFATQVDVAVLKEHYPRKANCATLPRPSTSLFGKFPLPGILPEHAKCKLGHNSYFMAKEFVFWECRGNLDTPKMLAARFSGWLPGTILIYRAIQRLLRAFGVRTSDGRAWNGRNGYPGRSWPVLPGRHAPQKPAQT